MASKEKKAVEAIEEVVQETPETIAPSTEEPDKAFSLKDLKKDTGGSSGVALSAGTLVRVKIGARAADGYLPENWIYNGTYPVISQDGDVVEIGVGGAIKFKASDLIPVQGTEG